ncbi:helix-turn-helix domain-containing protein [Hyphobacterium sp.]|uniref:helix-turn-helix transcriptional regulator n=1 Tax=Hyphobacterium sp. TaxID=2004662 RepID=UPI003749A362
MEKRLTFDPLALSANLRRSADCIHFVKDAERRYVTANIRLAAFFGSTDVSEILGRRTSDFFDDSIVARYDRLDREISEGRTLIDRFDCTYDHTGRARWYLYARTKHHDPARPCVRGISYPLPEFTHSDRVYRRLATATDTIAASLDEPVSMPDLADRADCSVAQIERDFARVLGESPKQYRSRLRVQCAMDGIRQGRAFTDIAHDSGYSEHSALSRAFKAATGLTPKEFRATLS